MPDGQGSPETRKRIEETCQWLRDNPLELHTPDHFFDVKWIRYKVISVGERHMDSHQRALVARKVRRWGGAHIGLAIEIEARHQEAIDRYLEGSGPFPVAAVGNRPVYNSILQAAAMTKTAVVAMDSEFGTPNRDEHMAKSVMELVHTKSKVLTFSGLEHAREGGRGDGEPLSMGERLRRTFGTRCYTICTFTQQGRGEGDLYYNIFKAAFGKRGDGIAFDVDRSPLAKAALTDPRGSLPWGEYCDGLMIFFKP